MRNLLHGGNAHWSAPTITHFSSFEIGDATVFTVPLDLDKKLSDFHKQFPLYNVAAMTQIERQSITMYRVIGGERRVMDKYVQLRRTLSKSASRPNLKLHLSAG